jgi:hypothetical protein
MRSSFSAVLVLLVLFVAAPAPAQTTSFFESSSTVVTLGTGNAWAPTLSADGLEIIFSSNRTGGLGGWDLWTAKRTGIDKPWGTPTNLKLLNNSASDFEPNLSADGLELFFVSTRTGKTGVSDVMVSTRLAPPLAWGAPKFVTGSINATSKAIDDPALTEDGLTMYYTVAVRDIYCSTRTSKTAAWANEKAFAPANNLGAVEHSPTPHANGNIMVFASTKSGGAGSADFYITYRNSKTNTWSTPTNMREINRTGWDSNASFFDLTGQLYWSDWTSGAQPIVRCTCYKLASLFVDRHPATSLVPFSRSYWPTPSAFAWRSTWSFSTTVRLNFFDCRKVSTWFLGVAVKQGPGIRIPGLIGGLELDPTLFELIPLPGTNGVPFTLSIPVPKSGTFPVGTVIYIQGFAIAGTNIVSTDLYEAEIR